MTRKKKNKGVSAQGKQQEVPQQQQVAAQPVPRASPSSAQQNIAQHEGGGCAGQTLAKPQQRADGRNEGRQQPAQSKPSATTLLGNQQIVPHSAQMKPPRRPGYGESGRAISLSANHFKMKIQIKKVYHYDVEVKEPLSAAMKRTIVTEFVLNNELMKKSIPVYDFKKNIYTARLIRDQSDVPISRTEFPFKSKKLDGQSGRAERTFTIVLQPTGDVEIDLTALDSYLTNGSSVDIPARAIQALEIALKFGVACRPGMVNVGRCLLQTPQEGRIVDLGQGAEVYSGHFQSLRLTWQATLNIDASQRAFATAGPVHKVMANAYRMPIGNALSPYQYKDFGKKIAKLKVSYPRENYTAKVGCNGLSEYSAREEKFDFEGRKISVQQYFEKKLNTKLQYPHLPCVWVGANNKKSYVPMELCTILAGQEYRRKLTDVQTTAMIRYAATSAPERKKRILDAVKSANFDVDPTMKAYGISVDTQMAQVQGRVLPAPTLVYGERETSRVVPKDGTWNMRNLRFVNAKPVGKYGIINLTRVGDDAIATFLGALERAALETGMVFKRDDRVFTRKSTLQQLASDMKEALVRFPSVKLIFVIIDRKGDPAYEIVKRVGDLELHVTTQCIQSKNVLGRNGPDPATMSNICLKLNAKFGGVNNSISRENRPAILNDQIIVLGADVTHPGADEGNEKPSVAAVVGSLDPRVSQYCCEIRVQKSRQEYIQDMEGMVYNILLKYYRANCGTSTGKPQRIVFYRDGVSEGQFAHVITHEIAAIQRACKRLDEAYKPPITFLVVQKRHHTRLFPNKKQDECGRSGNVPPGTVVDREIVHRNEHDFYLVSHFGIQGTSRPTHYHLLWDDNKLSADDLQTLTYHLCHLFSRCTRSVSYPAPCYYAHLVAFRGRQYYNSLIKRESAVTEQQLLDKIGASRDASFMFFV